MEVTIKESLNRTKYLEQGIIIGWMEKDMRVNGKIIKCMVREGYIGKMERNMKEIFIKIKEKGWVLLSGMMGGNM